MGDHVAETVETTTVASNDFQIINPTVRTAIYVVAFVINFLTLIVLGLGVVFDLIDPVRALAAGGVIVGALGMISSGLGIAYRPTKFTAP